MIENLTWLVLCIYFEARSEPLEGQIMVAHSVMNRAQNRKLSLEATIKQKKQYSWYNGREIPEIEEPKELAKCAKAAFKCLSVRAMGMRGKGVTHYYSDFISAPYWADSMLPLGKIGKHLFFREL